MIELLTQPFDFVAGHFASSNKRLFWLYSLSSVLLAIWLLSRSTSISGAIKTLFDKKVWLHTSAKQDYLVWFINGVIKAALIIPLLFSAAPIAIWLNKALEQIFGSANLGWMPESMVAISFTFILFLLDDFSRFFLHWLSHRVPLLWRFHQVHHSAKVLTPITVYRIHPVESAMYAVRLVFIQGLSIGIGVYLFGHKLEVIDVFGANVFIFAFNVFGANLRHSHIWLSWGSKLEYWFISPAQHQIHHSLDKAHYDKNFGSALAIWDRLFGCLLIASATTKPEKFGLKGKGLNTLVSLYLKPFFKTK